MVRIVILKFNIAVLFFLCSSFAIYGQIDLADTTALVIAHWKMNEIQQYKTSFTKTVTEEDNLISLDRVKYDLSIKVIDSTQRGYILELLRSNFVIETEDKLNESLLKITENIPILVLTDEFGSSIQALNWEDLGNEIKKKADALLTTNENFKDRISRIIRQSSSKEMVENNLLLDIQQLLAFHGAKYKFDERIDLRVKVPNNFGGDPLDANSTLIMDQVNLSQGSFIIRSSQRINPNQLTAVTYDYLKALNIEGADLPSFEEFPLVEKLIWGGAEIHGNSGWVIFSEETKQTNSMKVITEEERTIELRTAQ